MQPGGAGERAARETGGNTMERERWQMLLEVCEKARAGIDDLEADVIEANGRTVREFIHILKNGRAIGHLDITGLEAAQIEALLQRVCTGWVGGGAG